MNRDTLAEKPGEDGFTHLPEALEGHPKPSGPKPWNAPDLAFFIAFTLVWLPISNFLAYAGYSSFKPLFGWSTPLHDLQTNAFFVVAAQILFYAPVLAYVYVLVVNRFRLPFWDGLKWKNPPRGQIATLFLAGVLMALIARFAPPLLPDKENFPLERLFSSPQSAYAMAAFAVLLAPFMEELIFRGVLFSFFEQAGRTFAVLGTAILFAALHIPEYWGAWNHVLLVFLVGAVFSLARGLTGSLAPSVILHLAYNASLIAQLFFETDRFHSLQAGLIVR
jgi:membrane protease YdiL (CAAX protease family)